MARNALTQATASLRRHRAALPITFVLSALIFSTWPVPPHGAAGSEATASPAAGQSEAAQRAGQPQRVERPRLPPPPTPEVALISPAAGATVRDARTAFTWKLSEIPATVQRVFYRLTIVELGGGQTAEEALAKNRPAFERANLPRDSFQLPAAGAELAAGKVYAWGVTAFDLGGRELGRSPPSIFSFKSPPPPTCTFLPLATTVKYCAGGSITVGYANMSGSGPYTWTLNPTGGTGSTPASTGIPFTPIVLPASVLPTVPGTYNFTVTITRGGCTQTVPLTIEVFPPAAVGGSAVVSTPNPAQICDGQTAVLDVQWPAGTPPQIVGNWQYSDTGIFGPWLNATTAFGISGAPANTNQMSPSSCTAPNWFTDRWFRAQVSSSAAANAPACSSAFSALTRLRIYCKPVPGTASISPAQICNNGSSTPPMVTLQMTGGTVGDFDWYDASNMSTPLPGSHNVTPFSFPAPAGTKTYVAKFTTGGPCPPVFSNVVSVFVDTQPSCPATPLTADQTNICPGDAATLTLSGCSGIINWQMSLNNTTWTTIGSIGNTIQNTTDLNPPPLSTFWQAVVSSPLGICPAITAGPIQINIKQPPAAPVVPQPAPICFGATATLNITPQAGVTYQWYHDGIALPCTGPSCPVSQPGNYWVEASNGCEMVRSNLVTLPVNLITIKFGPTPCCGLGGSVTLSASADSSLTGPITNPGSYTWTQGGTTIGTGTSVTVSPQNTTTYCVTVVGPGGCQRQACTTITICH